MGFGVMASVLTNNVAALAALANGMLPLKRIAEAEGLESLERAKGESPMKRASNRTNVTTANSSQKSETADDGRKLQSRPLIRTGLAWQIVSDLPGRIRFRFAGLRRDPSWRAESRPSWRVPTA